MSLDISLIQDVPTEVYECNVTHNLCAMAEEAGLYKAIWRPEELDYSRASQLVYPLSRGLTALRADPDKFKELNPENGWGDYDGLVALVEGYLQACIDNPHARVEACR